MKNFEDLYIDYDQESDTCNVEVWASVEDCDAQNPEGFYGPLERLHWLGGVAHFQTVKGFPLLALRAYLDGLEYRVILLDLILDDHLTEDGLHISAQEPLFVPMVAEEHLYEFAERCIEFGMFE